jgi:hypothetical protein
LLSLQIKSNLKIKGALVNDTESLISQYADDTFLVLDGCETFFETSIIFFLKFRSGIELRSREKSIPSSLKLDTDQFNLKSGQRIWLEYLLFPTHTWMILNHSLVNMQMIHSLYLMVVRHHLGRPWFVLKTFIKLQVWKLIHLKQG